VLFSRAFKSETTVDIYLDANATTPVLPRARAAAAAAMEADFGNPSSIHIAGLRARRCVDGARSISRRVLGAERGTLVFTSGATEGIQTAVLSALNDLKHRHTPGALVDMQLLYGATEHAAVSSALTHWNEVLGLRLPIRAIPVTTDGRHDIEWLRREARTAGLVCTMAVNNETGVISDIDAIEGALAGSRALWLVDGVQALGKLPMRLDARRIHYAAFSGHKIYAPKGVGLLYVREGAPFTPLMVGGGQEGAFRSGTENVPGIAAFAAVLEEVSRGDTFAGTETLRAFRSSLAAALRDAFPGVVFNAPESLCVPTTLNFSVPGLDSRTLLDLFESAGMRVSGGSACSSAKSSASHVLKAMGLPDWQASSAIRMSFGAADDAELIAEACRRIREVGLSLPGEPASIDITARELLALFENGNAPLMVDVREQTEHDTHPSPWPGAYKAPLSTLDGELPRIFGVARESRVVFYCRSGNRSARAAMALRRMGHGDCWSLQGGIDAASAPA
jgi:cysteine sulfinate desulfinase/cysteine desulfurase-like protein/rhodanese-related sulfurtransferase